MPDSPSARSSFWLGCGLLLTPVLAAVTKIFAARISLDPSFGNALAFAGGALVPLCGLGLATRANVSLRVHVAVALGAAVILGVLALRRVAPLTAMLCVDFALVSLGWALGSAIGARVQHAPHLLPACVVAACADTISLLSPEGPTHAIAESERALSVVATWFPVPGTNALAPALGLGDLLFSALVFGVARAHGLPYLRAVALALAGTVAAGVAAARFGVAIPALVPIAAAILLGFPAIRKVRPADRAATTWSIAIASTLVIAVLARTLLAR